MMRIASRREKNTVIISIYGTILRDDVNTIIGRLHSYFDRGCRYYVIDLRHTRHVHYILGYRLSEFKRRVDSLGGQFNLVIGSKYIIQILRLSGDDWLYSLSKSQKQALTKILNYRRGNA